MSDQQSTVELENDPGVQGSSNQTADQQGSQASDQTALKDPVVTVTADTREVAAPPDPGVAIAGEGVGVGDIVNAASFGWTVLKDNVPVANQQTDHANALPSGVDFTALSGWEPNPSAIRFLYHCENIFGLNTTDLNVTCEWYFNGQHNGAGQYINAASVVASGDVSIGSTINIKASIGNPMNLGTSSNPLAALPVQIIIEHSTKALQEFTTTYSGLIKGNGDGVLKPS